MSAKKQLKCWLIIRNGENVRVVKAAPNLAPNEVAVAVVVNVPMPIRVLATVTVDLPEPPAAYASVDAVEYPPMDDDEITS